MVSVTCDFPDFQDSSSLAFGAFPYPDVSGDLFSAEGRTRATLRRSYAAPPWAALIENRLYELLDLGPNWDRRGSEPISYDDLRDALDFLDRVMRPDTRPPSFSPLATGGLELIWRQDNLEVEAIFDSARNERELLVSVGDNDSEAPIEEAESLFATVVDRLTADDPIAV